jgi:hypothetical protein
VAAGAAAGDLLDDGAGMGGQLELLHPATVRTFFTNPSRARRARRASWVPASVNPRRRESSADSGAAQLPPGSWSAFTREPSHAGRLLPLLGPPGHGGVGALQALATRLHYRSAATSQRRRALQGRRPSSRRSSLDPQKVTIKGALCASLRDGLRPPLTVPFSGSVRRLSEG